MKFYGTDKNGRPIHIFMLNGPAIKHMYDNLSIDQCFDMNLMLMERVERIVLPMCSERSGRKIGKINLFFKKRSNCENYSFRKR